MPIDEHDKNLTKLFWRGITLVALLGVAAGILIAFIALGTGNRAVRCVNNTLGARNSSSIEQTKALLDFSTAFKKAVEKELTPSQARMAVLTFNKAMEHVKANQLAHPLGKC